MIEHIVYWRGGADIRSDLVDALKGSGLNVDIVNSFEETLDLVRRFPKSALVVDAAADDNEVADRIEQLTGAELLIPRPVVFFGNQATSRTAKLMEQYPRLFVMDTPFRLDAIIARIHQSVSYEDGEHEDTLDIRPPDEQLEPVVSAATQFGSARGLLAFDDKKLIPDIPQKEKIQETLNKISAFDAPAGVHARRTAGMAAHLADSENGEDTSNLRTTSLMLNVGVIEEEPSLATYDILRADAEEILPRLAEGFLKSAAFAEKELYDQKMARTMESIAQITAGKSVSEDAEILNDAHRAIVAEVIGRACWDGDMWSPYGSYRAMHNLRRAEKPFFQNEKVVADMRQALGEAIASASREWKSFAPEIHLSAEIQRQRREDLERSLKEAEELYGKNADFLQLGVGDLRSGMTLARPLALQDGTMLIPANVSLDDDLIARVWGVAAVRAVVTPIVVLA